MFIPLNPPGLPWRNDARTSRVLSQLPFERATVHPSGRSALQHGLERSGFRGRAWAPAFLCRSAIEPLLKLGCPVRFYDVGEDLAPVLAWNEIGSGDVVMAVHFFGICRALEEVQAGCASVGATLIEDCAHTLPDPASTKPVGQRGDLAFFSLRKLLPVAAGGVLVGAYPRGRLRRKVSRGGGGGERES